MFRSPRHTAAGVFASTSPLSDRLRANPVPLLRLRDHGLECVRAPGGVFTFRSARVCAPTAQRKSWCATCSATPGGTRDIISTMRLLVKRIRCARFRVRHRRTLGSVVGHALRTTVDDRAPIRDARFVTGRSIRERANVTAHQSLPQRERPAVRQRCQTRSRGSRKSLGTRKAMAGLSWRASTTQQSSS